MTVDWLRVLSIVTAIKSLLLTALTLSEKALKTLTIGKKRGFIFLLNIFHHLLAFYQVDLIPKSENLY
jgi:hypothetical protein